MSEKNTQKTFVLKHLLEHGTISRNFCLKCYISRLGALIHLLKTEGLNIIPETGRNHGDYVYRLVK